jgi:hypothetical protein
MRPNDFASYLLAIGICNLLLYFAFYIIMKVNGKGGAAALLYGDRAGHWEILSVHMSVHMSMPVRFGGLGGLSLPCKYSWELLARLVLCHQATPLAWVP